MGKLLQKEKEGSGIEREYGYFKIFKSIMKHIKLSLKGQKKMNE